uniref:Protein kinase domain-containing protein n=1 Tax=Parascaris univalens TaxID=6257 RepID=A0A915A1T7_PARUN
MKVFVLRELKNRNAKYFCDVVDNRQFHNVNYIVMTLVGSSLQELRKMSSKASADKEKLTLGCALSVGIQCLEAIHELHDVGYLHRDVKPANFAIDKFDIRKIYLLDLGLCRKYVGRNGEVRRPRWAAGFRGTIRRACVLQEKASHDGIPFFDSKKTGLRRCNWKDHCRQEQGRK